MFPDKRPTNKYFTHVFFTVYLNFSLRLSRWMKYKWITSNVFTIRTSAKNWMKTMEWREKRDGNQQQKNFCFKDVPCNLHTHERPIERASNMKKLNGFIDRTLHNLHFNCGMLNSVSFTFLVAAKLNQKWSEVDARIGFALDAHAIFLLLFDQCCMQSRIVQWSVVESET